MQDSNETPETKSDYTSSDKNSLSVFGEKVDNTLAKKMIEEFKTKKAKLKFYNFIWAVFDKKKMLEIYADDNVLEVKFFVGVFPPEAGTKKEDAPVIIMQVKKSQTALLPVYEYYLGDTLCPPPNDGTCGTIESE